MSRGRGGVSASKPQPPQVDWGGWWSNDYTGTTEATKGAGVENRSLSGGVPVGTTRQFPWSPYVVTDFVTKMGNSKQPSMMQWSSAWKDGGGTYQTFSGSTSDKMTTLGMSVMRAWSPDGIGDPCLDSIIAGTHDAYITTFATDAKNWGKPFILRFAWEMNAGWFPWGASRSTNTAAKYVTMWRHVHDIFTSVGVPNCKWAWIPNDERHSTGEYGVTLEDCYPGDAYVDYVGIDAYNWGTYHTEWMSFEDIIDTTYDRLVALAPSKLHLIGEFGCAPDNSQKAQWFTDMFAALPFRFPKIVALMLFDRRVFEPSEHNWWFDNSTGSAAAFAAGIGNSRYKTNGAAF